MRSAARLIITGLIVLATFTPAPALAGPVAAASNDDRDDSGRLMLVLDSSGSMKEKAGGGQTKIAAAKSSLDTVIDGLPDRQPVGLRVYGAEVFSSDDKGACTDSQRVVDLDTDNRADLHRAVADYQPYGETPIGYALQQAGKDLGDEGRRTIVLVSDGEPTCKPDPCTVASRLAKSGVDLRIDVVGLDVSGTARDQLRCIAGSGNGSYYDAQDADDLVSALDTLSTRAARPYESIGTRITGAQGVGSAPDITAGDWQDTIGGAGSDQRELYYRLSDFDPTSTLHVSASINQPLGGKDAISVEVVRGSKASGDEHCVYGTARDAGADQVGLLSPSASWSYDPDDSAKAVCKPGDLYLRVRRGYDFLHEDWSKGGNNELPVEIRIIEEPAIVPDQPLPNRTDDAVFQIPEPTADRTELVGGSSFANAPTIEPGSYTDTVVPGETQVFLADVDWGQSLQAQLRPGRLGGALKKAIGPYGQRVSVEIYSPARAVATALVPDDSDGEITTNEIRIGNDFEPVARATTAPVRYKNREFLGGSAVENDAAAALAGKYAIVIRTDPDKDSDESYQVPVDLDLDVVGEKTGEPEYVSTPKKIGENPGTRDTAADTDGESGLPLLPIGLGVAGVVALGAALLVLQRSRRLP